MIPAAGVIAGPGGRVTLTSNICRARQHKRPLVWTKSEQAFIRGLGVQHAEHVVDLALCCFPRRLPGLFHAIDGVHAHRLPWSLKDGGLVHVIPEAGYA